MKRLARLLSAWAGVPILAQKTVWIGLAGLLALAPLAAAARTGHAQSSQAPLVVFIQGRRPLNTASISNVGPEGLSKLADMFRRTGARVQYLNITQPLPKDADVVVLVRPLRAMSVLEVAYLWDYLEDGGNLLIALDPEEVFLSSPSVRSANIRSRIGRSGLRTLIDQDFGVTLYDTFVAEPYMSTDSVARVETTYSLAPADSVRNPVTELLQQYNIPVWVWGARHMTVEPFVIGGQALPLIYTDTAFGEANQDIFRTASEPALASVELNLGEDFTGHLNLGALALDLRSGARLAILGDSEMIQNGFGLVSTGNTPRYPGNRIVAERLVAWLLELPPEEWPGLPDGFSWILLDGNGADWPVRGPSIATDTNDASPPAYNLQRVRAYADNRYVYLLVETEAPPDPDIQLTIALNAQVVGGTNPRAVITAAGVVVERDDAATEAVSDAAVGIGQAVEVRLPQRLFNDSLRVPLCAVRAVDQAEIDCLDAPVGVPFTNLLAPFDWALVNRPLATVYTSQGVFIRTGPGVNTRPVGTVYNGTTFAALGRNADASWIRVQNANFSGWMAAFLLTPNHDLTRLPEVAAPGG